MELPKRHMLDMGMCVSEGLLYVGCGSVTFLWRGG